MTVCVETQTDPVLTTGDPVTKQTTNPAIWLLKLYERPGYLVTDDLLPGGHVCFFTEEHAVEAAIQYPHTYPVRIV